MRARIISIVAILLCWIMAAANAQAGEIIRLDQAQRLALENNHDIKELVEKKQRADITLIRACTMLLPSIYLRGSITRHDKSIKFPSDSDMDLLQTACDQGDVSSCATLQSTEQMTIQDLWGYSTSLTATMPLFYPRSIPLIMNADSGVDVMDLMKRHGESELLYSVTAAYYAVLQADKLVDVAEKALERSQDHLKSAQNKVKAGKGVRLEVLRAEMRIAEAEKALTETTAGRDLARQGLGFLIGRPETFGVVLPEIVAKQPEGSVPSLVENAQRQRLDLRAMRENVVIADRNNTDAWLKFAPDFSIQGSYSWANASGFSNSNSSWQVMFMANLPILEAGTQVADIMETASKTRSSQIEADKLAEQIANQVREAELNLNQARAKLDVSIKQSELARENYELVKRQYDVGLVDNLTMLDAETELFRAEQSQAREELSEILAILTLRQRSGFILGRK